METPTVGDIVAVKFPYSDLSSDKVRPALVIAVAEFGDLIVCQITSKPYTSRLSVRISPSDAKGMVVESYIRPDKIFTSDKSLVMRIIAKVSPAKLKATRLALRQILNTDV